MYKTGKYSIPIFAVLLTFLVIIPGQGINAQTSVFINEIHYDNSGTDAGEAVEIAGPAGTDLTGWSIVLYNGSSSQLKVYNTTTLSGTIPDLCGGYGTVVTNYPSNGIQNGAPDGLALVDVSNNVIQFLSYEGSFTAVDGPAVGMTSTDIGVYESSSTPVGHSLQLSGNGTYYEDFTWNIPAANTFNACNIGQTFVVVDNTPVFINELHYDNASSDVGEAVEVAGPAGTDLTGWSIVLYNGSATQLKVYKTTTLTGTIPDICGGYGAIAFYITSIQNGSPDGLALVDASSNVIQFLSYEGSFTAVDGPAAGMTSDDIGVSEGGSNPVGNSLQLSGTGTVYEDFVWNSPAPNTFDACNTGQSFTGGPIAGWVINEILADPAGDITGDANGDGTRHATEDEFVEIVNNTGSTVDISGWTISDGYGVRHTFPGGTEVPNQSAVVVFGGGTPTGDFGYAIVQTANTGALGLNNGGDTVALNDGITDVATYNYSSEGSNNQSITRDPDITGSDPLVHHSTATGSGGALFSPGAMIDGSPFPGAVIPPPVYEIYELQGNSLSSPYVGQIVTTENNVVTALSYNGFFIQTPTARTDADISTSDGILVYTGPAPTVSVGDLVNVSGEIKEHYDLTEIIDATITVVGTETLPEPVTFDGLLPSPNQPSSLIEFERFESMLITIADGTVTGSNQGFGSDPIAEVYIVAGSERTYREPGVEYPGTGVPGIPTWDGNPEVFELDPNKLGILPNLTIPAGSSFEATGVLGYEYGGYEFWPYELYITEAEIPVAVPEKQLGEYTVGSLNLYRLFDDIADGGTTVSSAEYAVRLSKFSQYIREILDAPDILAVEEVENLGVLEDLAAQIAIDDGSIIYNAYLVEGNDVGGIDVGFLARDDRVQVDAVTQLGALETYLNPNTGVYDILHDRPPLLLEGSFIVDGLDNYPIAVMAVHIRSLNGIETIRVQTKRLAQAESIAEKVQTLQDANPDVHLAVTGDFNAFEFTDGYVDVVGHIMGEFDPTESVLSGSDLVNPNLTNQVLGLLPEDRYSFIYRGNAQVLDHALTSIGLDPAITGFAYGRGNSDAAKIHIENGSSVLRSSDHDGLVLYVDATPPQIIFNNPYSIWPVNHKYETFNVSDMISTITEDGEELPIESAYILKVTSDEPEDENGNGDGKTKDDIVIVDCQTMKLRVERAGGGNGRVYTVYFAVENDNGYTGYGSYQIGVPHDKKDIAIDDGAVYEVLSDCEGQNGLGKILVGAEAEETTNNSSLPSEYALKQNFPNPFNPNTTISYQLPEASNVTLTIYDISGRKVRELQNSFESAGFKSVNWNGRDDYGQAVSGGVYIYYLKASNYHNSQKMILMK